MKLEDDLTVVLLNKTFYRAMPVDTYERPILPPRYGGVRGREFGVNPIGTGHYKFVEYRSKSHLRLEVNSDYHGHWDGKAKNTSVTFRYLSENATRVAALEAGEVHLIDNLPPDAVERVRRNPSLDVRFTPSTRINGMNFHCGRPPFNNLRARLAAVHAIDREAIAKRIMGGMTAVATAPFPDLAETHVRPHWLLAEDFDEVRIGRRIPLHFGERGRPDGDAAASGQERQHDKKREDDNVLYPS